MAGGAREEDGDERRGRRGRSTRDRRGRARTTEEDTPSRGRRTRGAPPGTSWSRNRRTSTPPEDTDPPATGTARRKDADTPRRDGAGSARRDDSGSAGRDGAGSARRDGTDTSRRDDSGSARRDGTDTSRRDDSGSARRDGTDTSRRDGAGSARRDGAGSARRAGAAARGTASARRAGSAVDGTVSARRATTRERTRRRAEPARPDTPSRASRVRSGTDRPSTRRPRSDAVRARRTESAERRAPTRGRYLARRWVALLVVLTVVAVAYLVMFTSVLGVRSVEVIGAKEIPEDAVLKAAAIEHGTPMVRLDADEAAASVAKLPRVHEVVVERSWPSTVEIIITERTPVAILRSGEETHLVDSTGLDYAKVTTPSPGLPTLAMTDVRPGNPATKAAVTVLGAIPNQLKTQVTTITANTPGDVRLTLTDGRVVKWGNAEDNARKAAVLAPLLTRPGKTYDVATPDFPTVSG